MTPDLTPSKTLRRAARADRERLGRAIARNQERQEDLRAELATLESDLQLLEERDRLLEHVAGTELEADAETDAATGAAADEVLRGAQIREQAARAFYRRHGGGEARHYRVWFDLLIGEGVEIAGKDPMATFLTNLTRSPVVVRGTEAGTYEIDADADARLRNRLGELNAELVDLARVLARDETAGSDLLAHRAALLSEIRKHERLLAEAERVLGLAEEDLAEAA